MIGYNSLSEVKKNLRIQWYRSPIDKEILRVLTLKSDLKGFIQAGGHFLIIILTGLITYFFWLNSAWFYFFIALFLHGTASSFLKGVAPHELGHGTVFRTRKYNKFFLYLFSLISWWDPFDYAVSHTYHHRFSMYPNADRENLLPLKPSLELSLLIQLFSFDLFSKSGRNFSKGGIISTIYLTFLSSIGKTGSLKIPSQEWLKSLHFEQPNEHRKSIFWSRMLLFFHGSLLIFSLASGLWVLPLIITFSTFTASWASYFVGLTQHCGLKDNDPDFRKCTRTITINPVLSFLYWHMNWHLEHHMYAGVPCYNLKKLNSEIKDDLPVPRTLVGAWKEMRETWHRQQEDPDFQFDTAIPAQKINNSSTTSNPLEYSIGDLAPEGLSKQFP